MIVSVYILPLKQRLGNLRIDAVFIVMFWYPKGIVFEMQITCKPKLLLNHRHNKVVKIRDGLGNDMNCVPAPGWMKLIGMK